MEMTFLNSGLYYSWTKKIFYYQLFMTKFIKHQIVNCLHTLHGHLVLFKKKFYFIFVFNIDQIKSVSSTGVVYYFLVLFIDLAPETLIIKYIYWHHLVSIYCREDSNHGQQRVGHSLVASDQSAGGKDETTFYTLFLDNIE